MVNMFILYHNIIIIFVDLSLSWIDIYELDGEGDGDGLKSKFVQESKSKLLTSHVR
jgi:hypothetical protein